jgi:hypothetical protein
MDRRDFIKAGLVTTATGTTGFGPLGSAAAEPDKHYELRVYELRNDINPGRIRTFFKDALVPALARSGVGTVGVFSPDTGFPSQSLVAVIEYQSIAAIETVRQRLADDAEYTEARRAFENGADLPFVRYDARLMRAFSGHRTIEVPPVSSGRPSRMFELRTYEARTDEALAHKVAMFNEGEIALFRQIGMTPVFFGENVFGTGLPSLTYMLTFDDIAARTKAWAAFGANPDWQRMNKDPRWNVLGNVSMIHVAYLSPLSFSPIR